MVQPNKLNLQIMCHVHSKTYTVPEDSIIGDLISTVKNSDEYYKKYILGFYIAKKTTGGEVTFSYFGYDYLLHKKWSDYPEFIELKIERYVLQLILADGEDSKTFAVGHVALAAFNLKVWAEQTVKVNIVSKQQ